jgi:hypothetical protein
MRAKVQQSENELARRVVPIIPGGPNRPRLQRRTWSEEVRETCLRQDREHIGRNPPARPRGIASPLTGPKRTPDREYPWQTLEGAGTLDASNEDRAIHAWTGQGRSPGEDW